MGEWQKDELLGKDIAYLIAINEGIEHGSVATAEDLQALQDYLDVSADAWLLDIEGRRDGIIADYCEQESSGDCTASVTVVIDQHMRIQFFGATHENDATNALEVMLGLFED